MIESKRDANNERAAAAVEAGDGSAEAPYINDTRSLFSIRGDKRPRKTKEQKRQEHVDKMLRLELGFTPKNILIGVLGAAAVSAKFFMGRTDKPNGKTINDYPKLRNTLLVVGLLGGAALFGRSCTAETESTLPKVAIESPAWPDGCKGLILDQLKPGYTVWGQVGEIPGISVEQRGPVVSVIDEVTPAMTGDNGDIYSGDLAFVRPAVC